MFRKIIEVLNRAGCDRLEFVLNGQDLEITAHRNKPAGKASYTVSAAALESNALDDDDYVTMIMDRLIRKFP